MSVAIALAESPTMGMVAGRVVGLELGDRLVAAHHRHHHVEDDEIGVVVAGKVDGLAAVGGLVHVVALGLEGHRDDAQDIGVVIGDDDRLGHGSAHRPS